jgi:hypothetical protein
MKSIRYGLLAGVVVLLAGVSGCVRGPATTPLGDTTFSAGGGVFRLSGPYTHKNLTVFLVHGEDRIKGKEFLTLEEAMVQKKVIVHETSNVNELAIENVSDVEVFVQAGDIVKGGKQDRVLSVDTILPAKSGKRPISSFCVEQGRWSRRGGESTDAFSGSCNNAVSNSLKIAIRHKGQQGQVWKEVEKLQGDITRNVESVEIDTNESPSSLELTLGSKELRKVSEEYRKALAGIGKGKPDTIGYVFAVNGEIRCADVFAAHGLFKKLWKKLLDASVVEAVAGWRPDLAVQPVAAETVRIFFRDAQGGMAQEKRINDRMRQVTRESKKALLFESKDDNEDGQWVRQNYLKKK